jgi:hypothetical protein
VIGIRTTPEAFPLREAKQCPAATRAVEERFLSRYVVFERRALQIPAEAMLPLDSRRCADDAIRNASFIVTIRCETRLNKLAFPHREIRHGRWVRRIGNLGGLCAVPGLNPGLLHVVQ